jgi:hypothetical protein
MEDNMLNGLYEALANFIIYKLGYFKEHLEDQGVDGRMGSEWILG